MASWLRSVYMALLSKMWTEFTRAYVRVACSCFLNYSQSSESASRTGPKTGLELISLTNSTPTKPIPICDGFTTPVLISNLNSERSGMSEDIAVVVDRPASIERSNQGSGIREDIAVFVDHPASIHRGHTNHDIRQSCSQSSRPPSSHNSTNQSVRKTLNGEIVRCYFKWLKKILWWNYKKKKKPPFKCYLLLDSSFILPLFPFFHPNLFRNYALDCLSLLISSLKTFIQDLTDSFLCMPLIPFSFWWTDSPTELLLCRSFKFPSFKLLLTLNLLLLMTQTGTPDSSNTGPSPLNLITGLTEAASSATDYLFSPTANTMSDNNYQTDPAVNTGLTVTGLTDPAVIKALADELEKRKKAASTTQKPRCGGVYFIGAWTGGGDPTDKKKPYSNLCIRKFNSPDIFKTVNTMTAIETGCKAGMSNHKSGALFADKDEPNTDQFVPYLRIFRDIVRLTGMEGVFIIITRTGIVINMFDSPGLITQEILDQWIEDLLTKGVIDLNDTTTRLKVCPHDATNLSWSGSALMSSCTEGLKVTIQNNLTEDKRVGPRILFFLLSHLYRPSTSKVEKLQNQLKAMDITKYPAENVSLFTKDATTIIKEIKLNFLRNDQCPNLTRDALAGLVQCSVPVLQMEVVKARVKANTLTFGQGSVPSRDPVELLNDFTEQYKALEENGDWPPAKVVSKAGANLAEMQQTITNLQANQAKLEAKLVQDRDATSTTGNGNGNGKGNGKGNKKRKENGLSQEEFDEVKTKVDKIKPTMPERQHIPDDHDYKIMVNNKVGTKYCRHCGRFTWGTNAHSTLEHKGRGSRCEYVPPDKDNVKEEKLKPALKDKSLMNPDAAAALAAAEAKAQAQAALAQHLDPFPGVHFQDERVADYGLHYGGAVLSNDSEAQALSQISQALSEYDNDDGLLSCLNDHASRSNPYLNY